MEPFRPYLIGFTVLVLAYAWYQKLNSKKTKEVGCACEEDKKRSFWQTKAFLGIITIFALIMMAFPYYGKIFYPKNEPQVAVVSFENMQELELNVSGMTCNGCQDHVENTLGRLPGVSGVSASYIEERVKVKFDAGQTNKSAIVNAINGTGYTVEGETTVPENSAHGEKGHVCGPDGCN